MNRRKKNGFSLIEVMIAAGLLATVAVTICTLGAKSLSSMRICQEYEKAWDVLDRQMLLLEQVGVNNLAGRPTLSGVIEDAQSQTQWQWRADIELLDVEKLYSLTLTVNWVSGGKLRQIQCDTRLRALEEVESSETTNSTSSSSSSSTQTTTAAGESD